MTRLLCLFSALVLSVAAVTGCENFHNPLSGADTGTILGGAAGGAVGSQIGSGTGKTIATVVGAVAGAALGRRVGQNMERSDRHRFGRALESNQTGNTDTWTNPDTNDHYSVTPTRTYSNSGRPCREFTMDANVNGQPDKVTGTACRQPDGTWQVQS